jgi:hypothetical protein
MRGKLGGKKVRWLVLTSDRLRYYHSALDCWNGKEHLGEIVLGKSSSAYSP